MQLSKINTHFNLFTLLARAVWKVPGLTLLLRVGSLWRCGDGLFFEEPPLASDALLTTLRPLLANLLLTVDYFEIFCLKAPFSWLEKPRNRMGRYLDCMADVLMGFYWSTFYKPNTEFNSYLASCDFWAFPTMKRELCGKKFRSDQRSAARFREKWVDRCKKCIACQGRYFEKETVTAPSPTRSNKVGPRTLQTALLFISFARGT
jgi:hypothetical protein